MARGMMAQGSKGQPVQILQENLVFLGINPGPIDGVFGPKTEAAVKRFQKLQGLEVDGIVGPKTREAIVARKRDLKQAARQRERAAKLAKPVAKPAGKGVAPKTMPTKTAASKTMAGKMAAAKAAAAKAPAKKPAAVKKVAAPKATTMGSAAKAIVDAAKKAAGKP